MSGYTLDGYTTVNERIIKFYDKYPDGIISTHPAKIIEVGGNLHISVQAEVKTNPDGLAVIAEAWETYPGKTPYTRDSEMMNCATSAIGRALMQLGIGIEKGAASLDEVKVAQERRSATGDGPAPATGRKHWKATEKQIGAVMQMFKAIPQNDKLRLLEAITTKSTWDELTGDDIDLMFSIKASGVAERYQALSAIWAEPSQEDDPWAVDGL